MIKTRFNDWLCIKCGFRSAHNIENHVCEKKDIQPFNRRRTQKKRPCNCGKEKEMLCNFKRYKGGRYICIRCLKESDKAIKRRCEAPQVRTPTPPTVK